MDNYVCYVIVDGIDKDKELESVKIVVIIFIKDFIVRFIMNKFILRKYLKKVNDEFIVSSRNVRLKVLMIVVIINYSKLIYLVIGNIRFYYFKDGYLKYKSKD